MSFRPETGKRAYTLRPEPVHAQTITRGTTVKKRIIGIALLGTLALAPAVNAKTLYISDSLRIDMRSGPSMSHRILDFLSSGTSLQVVKEEGDWVQIKVGEKEGWVQAQYTSPTPSARDRLERSLRDMETLKNENKSLREQLKSTQDSLGSVKSDFQKVSGSATDLQRELDRITNVSRTHIETEMAYRQLQEDTELLKVDLEKLKVENARLVDDNRKEGIKWGAGAVILGMFLTWLISKSMGRKRRSSW